MSMINVDETPVMFNSTSLVPFVVIRKQIGPQFTFNDTLEEYITFSFQYEILNWDKPVNGGRLNKTSVPTKLCVSSDFGTDERSVKMFNSWKDFTMLCPTSTEFELLGDTSSMLKKSISFEVNKCNISDRAGKTPCQKDSDINDYIRDFQVDFWVQNEKIDFSTYDKKPVFKVEELQRTVLLNDKDITHNYEIYLR